MCCFSRPVKEVSGTKIFARGGEGTSQFLVYEMHVSLKEPAAMILPLPVDASKGEKAVRFIDLQGYPNFFDDLLAGFTPVSLGMRGGPMLGGGQPRKLEVHRVGAFDASFVPTIADFSRLDERFRLPNGTWEKLPNYKDWGFAVFKLREGEQRYHPMAFSFDRKSDAALFFPTVHIHDGKVHSNADFDHALYCQPGDAGLALENWTESFGQASRYVKMEKNKGIVDGSRHCYRYYLRGRRPNRDIYVLKA